MTLKILLALVFLSVLTATAPARAADTPIWTGLSAPVGLIYDAEGRLYVAESGADRVSRLEPGGRKTLVTEAVKSPAGLALDDQGVLYVAGLLRRRRCLRPG